MRVANPASAGLTAEERPCVAPKANGGAASGAVSPPEFSDDALALRFTQRYGAELRYVAPWGRWLKWDGARWVEEDTLQVFDLARRICREASPEMPPERRAALRITSAATRAAVESLARADRRHAARPDQFDAHQWTLNTPAGLVNLKTGELRAPDRLAYCTKATAEGPAPNPNCPPWRGFLERITDGDAELQSFLQRVAGYCLTGSVREHALFFCYGTGANGKSVFLGTLSGILGDYARTARRRLSLPAKASTTQPNWPDSKARGS